MNAPAGQIGKYPIMPVVHAAKRRSFTSISNDLAENPLLSFTARGLALYLLAKPPDWNISIIDLQKRGGCPKAKLRQAMIELEKAGYLVFYRAFEGRGKMRSFWQVFETAVDEQGRSRSFENVAAKWLSSPLKSFDVGSSDVSRRDIVNTHVVNTHETHDSQIGEESPNTPLWRDSAQAVLLPFSPSPLTSNNESTDRDPPPVQATGNDSFAGGAGSGGILPQVARGGVDGGCGGLTPQAPLKMQRRANSAQMRAPVKAKPDPDPRASHPAIAAVRDLAKRFPDKILWDKIIELIGDKPDADRLKSCFMEHVERGFNKNSWKWVTEWYGTGIPQNSATQRKTRNLDHLMKGIADYGKTVERGKRESSGILE